MLNEWREPMTGAQAAELRTLSRLAREPEAFAPRLSRAAAAQRIDVLRAKLSKDWNAAQHKPE
jgi:DUF3072 family protein